MKDAGAAGPAAEAAEAEPEITITYTFRFPDGEEVVVAPRLRSDTLELGREPPRVLPDWTALAFHQCSNCPLTPARSPLCPVAAVLPEVVEIFGDRLSYEEVDLDVMAPNRTFRCHAPMQDALHSLLGLYMAASGCPHLEPLRPMLLIHLPQASPFETAWRSVSMYLIAQYLRARRGLEPDWECLGLRTIYERIHEVNLGLSRRLAAVSTRDAGLNSLVKLDLFTWLVPQAIEKKLEDYVSFFASYLQE